MAFQTITIPESRIKDAFAIIKKGGIHTPFQVRLQNGMWKFEVRGDNRDMNKLKDLTVSL